MAGINLPDVEFQALVGQFGQSLDPPMLGSLCTQCRHPPYTLTTLGSEAPWPAMAVTVLRRAELDMWLGELLEVIIDSPALGAPIIEASRRGLLAWRKAEAQAERYSPRDPKSALMLFNDAPFVDRVDQRQHVQLLVQRQGRRVMIVRGEPACGKTHTGLFVRHLVEKDQNLQMAPVRLQEMGGERIGAIDLMTEIADRMGFSTQGENWDTMAQEARQAEKLTRWLEARTASLSATQKSWLLVIDGLNHPRVGSGALELVDRLIISGSRGDLVKVSLLLLALPTPPPAHVAGDVLDITLPPLTETDFRTHALALAKAMQSNLPEGGPALIGDFLLKDLRFPLGHEGMDEAGKRLRQLPAVIERLTP
jgi:hypothetical protein